MQFISRRFQDCAASFQEILGLHASKTISVIIFGLGCRKLHSACRKVDTCATKG